MVTSLTYTHPHGSNMAITYHGGDDKLNQVFIVSIFYGSTTDFIFLRAGMEKPNISRDQILLLT